MTLSALIESVPDMHSRSPIGNFGNLMQPKAWPILLWCFRCSWYNHLVSIRELSLRASARPWFRWPRIHCWNQNANSIIGDAYAKTNHLTSSLLKRRSNVKCNASLACCFWMPKAFQLLPPGRNEFREMVRRCLGQWWSLNLITSHAR